MNYHFRRKSPKHLQSCCLEGIVHIPLTTYATENFLTRRQIYSMSKRGELSVITNKGKFFVGKPNDNNS